jgi:hypothetical protein
VEVQALKVTLHHKQYTVRVTSHSHPQPTVLQLTMKIRICEYLKMWIHHKRNDTISEKLIGIIRTTMKNDDSAKKTYQVQRRD